MLKVQGSDWQRICEEGTIPGEGSGCPLGVMLADGAGAAVGDGMGVLDDDGMGVADGDGAGVTEGLGGVAAQ